VKLNLSHIRLLKYLSDCESPATIKACEEFLTQTDISLSSAKKYIEYLKLNDLIIIKKNPDDRRSKLVSLNPSLDINIDKLI